jgi:hypothetical protein
MGFVGFCLIITKGPGWELEFQFPPWVLGGSFNHGQGTRLGIGISIPTMGFRGFCLIMAKGPGWELEFQFPPWVLWGSV